MNTLVLELFAFVALGLAHDRLGRMTYPLMVLIVLIYVIHAY